VIDTPLFVVVALVVVEVCIRTLIRSNGCPIRTEHAPPTPPEMNEISNDDVCNLEEKEEDGPSSW
jgi:hypothetical protein